MLNATTLLSGDVSAQSSAPDEAQVLATLALSGGGLGLSSAQMVRRAAHFASWADELSMVRQRHTLIAETTIRHLEEGTALCFQAVRECRELVEEAGLEVPSWTELSVSPLRVEEEPEPNQPRQGWQQKATKQLEIQFLFDVVWPGLNDSRRAMLRSQHGPLASAALTALPTSRATRIASQPFSAPSLPQTALSSPLVSPHLPMWPVPSRVRRSASMQGAGARVSSNMFVRDMLDGRRLDIVADGLTLWQGAQLAIDATMVSLLRRDGTFRPRAANHDGVVLEATRRRKEATCPELSGENGRARLVVLAAEVGGRWNSETAQFITALANARAQEVPLVLQGRAQAAWARRWTAILACTAARAFCVSLLELSSPRWHGGDNP